MKGPNIISTRQQTVYMIEYDSSLFQTINSDVKKSVQRVDKLTPTKNLPTNTTMTRTQYTTTHPLELDGEYQEVGSE